METLAAFSIPSSLCILYFRSHSFCLSFLQHLFSKEVGNSFLALPWLHASPIFSGRHCRRTSTPKEESGAGAAVELKASASSFTAADFLP